MAFLRHTSCDSCSSSDARAIYSRPDGGEYSYCFSCSTLFGDSLESDEDKLPEASTNSEARLAAILGYPSKGDASRGLTQWAMEYYGVRTELSTSDGTTPVAHYYPYTRGSNDVVAFKVRRLPKDFFTVGDYRALDFFGQRQALNSGGKRVIITEGEADAVALFQALKMNAMGTEWADLNPAVVSIGFGSAAAVKDLTRNIDFLKRFEDVILCFDQDAPGQEAVANILKLLPEAKVASFNEKDANAMVMKGKHRELAQCVLFRAQKVRPASIATVADLRGRALKKPEWGLSWPWPSLTKETYGLLPKKLYGLGAGVKMGKSEWNKEVQEWLMFEHKEKIGIFMFEEPAERTVKALAGKRAHKFFYKPDEEYDDAELLTHIDSMDDKLFVYDHFGGKDWDEVRAAIRYMVVSEEIRWIFLDPLTALVSHLNASAANDMLNRIFSELSGMMHELNFSVFYSSHLNLPDTGPPHEQGGEALESQMTGSRAAMKWSNYVFMLQGNKNPELPDEERNTRWLVCRSDREFGRVFKFPVYYNQNTGVFRENQVRTGAY